MINGKSGLYKSKRKLNLDSYKIYFCAEFKMKFLIVNLLFVGVTLGAGVPALPHPLLRYSGRVVGGEEVEPHTLPYQGALIITVPGGGQMLCGCSLISENWVLTAAHCVPKAASFLVILGAHRFQQYESTQYRINADESMVHPDWNEATLGNDVALLHLEESVTYTNEIQPITLAPRDVGDLAYKTCTVSGWGKYFDTSEINPVLYSADLQVISNAECTNTYGNFIQSTHLCCSGEELKSSCNGDSGGPLTYTTDDEQVVQVGVVSFGSSEGCEKGYPSAYARVSEYRDWIDPIINPTTTL